MEKGHFGGYTGNARHSRKEEMIHDRELIYDAKKQLHDADQDYKHDTRAKMYGTPLENSGLGPKTVDTPMFNLNKGYTPLKNVAAVFDKASKITSQLGGDTSTKGMYNAGAGDTSYMDNGGLNRFSDVNETAKKIAENIPSKNTESVGVPSGTSAGADRRERRLGKAERKASVSTGKTKARLEKKADRIKRRQTIKGDGLQSKPTVKPSGGSGSKSSSGLGGSGGSGSGSQNSGNTNINTITINGKKQ